jgi:hypothetical protein
MGIFLASGEKKGAEENNGVGAVADEKEKDGGKGREGREGGGKREEGAELFFFSSET